MFKVETYQDPIEYFHNLRFQTDELHITTTTSLSIHLQNNSSNTGTFIDSYDNFLDIVFPNWRNPLTQIVLAAKVRAFINRLDVQHKLKKSMTNRMEDLLDSISFLVESGMYKLTDLPDIDTEKKIFMQTFNYLMEDHDLNPLFHELAIESKVDLENRMNRKISKIFLYQFTQMDSARMRLIHNFRSIGIEVIFRIPYYPQFPNLNEGWHRLYKSIIQGKSQIPYPIPSKEVFALGSKLVNFYENLELNHPDNGTIRRTTFQSFADLRYHVNKRPPIKNKYELIGTSFTELNKAFRDINKRYDEVRNVPFTLTPFGKFLFFLYECKRIENEILLDYDLFVECVTSGWIETRTVSGIKALALIKDLTPYMEGIGSIREIFERLKSLESLLDVSREFDDLARDQVDRNKIKRYLSNPFRAFSYVNGEHHTVTIKQLIELTSDLETKLSILLPEEGKSVSITEHIQSLNRIWSRLKHLPIKENSPFQENILTLFNQRILAEYQMERQELRDAITVVLTRKIKEEAELFKGLDQLEGLMLRTKEMHITDLSAKSLRGYIVKRKYLPKYLNHSWMKESLKQYISNTQQLSIYFHSLLVDYISRQCQEVFLNFSFFHLISFYPGEITLSWIEKFHDHDFEGLILKILSNVYKSEEYQLEIDLDFNEIVEAESLLPQTKMDATKLERQFPVLYWLDHDFCSMKFFFTSILQMQPVYESEFHQQIVFANLGTLFEQIGGGREAVRKYIYPLFPQWTDTLKENLIQTNYFSSIRDYRQFQNIAYPKAMDRFQRLRSRYEVTRRWKIRNAYNKNSDNESIWMKEFEENATWNEVKSEPGPHCKMCSFLNICTKGEYAVDSAN